jgi:hypothetical protein
LRTRTLDARTLPTRILRASRKSPSAAGYPIKKGRKNQKQRKESKHSNQRPGTSDHEQKYTRC